VIKWYRRKAYKKKKFFLVYSFIKKQKENYNVIANTTVEEENELACGRGAIFRSVVEREEFF